MTLVSGTEVRTGGRTGRPGAVPAASSQWHAGGPAARNLSHCDSHGASGTMTEASQLRDWQTLTRDVRRRVRLGMTRNFKFKFESSPARHAATHWQFKLNLTMNAESKPLLVNGCQFQ